MKKTTPDHGSADAEAKGAPRGPRGSSQGDADRGRSLPDNVSVALLEAERDFLLAKYRDLGSQLGSFSEKLRDLGTLTASASRLEAVYQKQAETTRRLEDETLQLRRHLERMNETELRHLAEHVQGGSHVRLPRKLRWVRLFRPRHWRKLYRLGQDYKLLARSPLFDGRWYLARNEDVASSGADPILHYLERGAAEGRSPSASFDAQGYLQANPDVAAAGDNPLVHFLRRGFRESRRISLSGTPEPTRSPGPGSTAHRERSPKPRTWFYLGDTLEWLRDHSQLTGVGHVSSELFFASVQRAAETSLLPCVLDPRTSRLTEVPLAEQYVYLSQKLGRPLTDDLQRAMAVGAAGRSPEPGDHVFFTGLVWTPTFTQLFQQLSATGIDFSVLVFDIIPIESPDLVGDAAFRSFSEWLATTVNTASAIYVSSPSVKDKILRWAVLSGLEVKPEIFLIPFGVRRVEGAPSADAVARDPQTATVSQGGFVLSVGTIDRRKNQVFLCRLWRRLVDELGVERTPQLVLVGRNDERVGSAGSEFADIAASGKLLVLEGLSDEQLARLYKTCLFTAFPSLSEGYGLPVAESLQYGKLCLSSELPEVRQHAGDLCWYFSPADLPGALPLFVRAVADHAARHAAESQIAREYRAPTWGEVMDELLRVARAPRAEAPGLFTAGPQLPSFPGLPRADPTAALAKAGRWCTEVDPEVSILVINWNAARLTLECIRQIWWQTEGHTYEVVVVDNGSAPQDVAKLRRLGPGVRLLELGCNRFFGEANNIAAEAARGRFLCLLNNDAFVRAGWLTALVSAVTADPQVGASGPLFLFPDGSIQEAGAMIDAGGYPVRLGRGEKEASPELLQPKFVDYVSAASLLIPRDVFLEAGGFDLSYEPAYYEDADLCLKIQALGRKVLYCPAACVVHHEGSSANGDPVAEARRKALGDLNRDKFVSRWGSYLRTRDPQALVSLRACFAGVTRSKPAAAMPGASASRTAVMYTPYAITPGGGERYLMTMAVALARGHRVTVVTPHPYSTLRVRNIGHEFGLDLSGLQVSTAGEFSTVDAPDVMVALGNHVVPGIRGRGKVNIYICQFPFPMSRPPGIVEGALLDSYDRVIVYSDYARDHFLEGAQAHRLPTPPVEILRPPVPQFEGDAARKRRLILSVGRFFVGGHSKRHDLLITAFKRIAGRLQPPVELHLAGSSTPTVESMDYLAMLRASAEGLPIHFHVNASQEKLRELYRDAAVYWHGTGLGVNLGKEPEKAEHFGISLLEAMSAQTVSFALDAGGPREIITSGENGFLYKTLEEMSDITLKLLAAPSSRAEEIGRAAAAHARRYSPEAFADRFEEIVKKLEGDLVRSERSSGPAALTGEMMQRNPGAPTAG